MVWRFRGGFSLTLHKSQRFKSQAINPNHHQRVVVKTRQPTEEANTCSVSCLEHVEAPLEHQVFPDGSDFQVEDQTLVSTQCLKRSQWTASSIGDSVTLQTVSHVLRPLSYSRMESIYTKQAANARPGGTVCKVGWGGGCLITALFAMQQKTRSSSREDRMRVPTFVCSLF